MWVGVALGTVSFSTTVVISIKWIFGQRNFRIFYLLNRIVGENWTLDWTCACLSNVRAFTAVVYISACNWRRRERGPCPLETKKKTFFSRIYYFICEVGPISENSGSNLATFPVFEGGYVVGP